MSTKIGYSFGLALLLALAAVALMMALGVFSVENSISAKNVAPVNSDTIINVRMDDGVDRGGGSSAPAMFATFDDTGKAVVDFAAFKEFTDTGHGWVVGGITMFADIDSPVDQPGITGPYTLKNFDNGAESVIHFAITNGGNDGQAGSITSSITDATTINGIPGYSLARGAPNIMTDTRADAITSTTTDSGTPQVPRNFFGPLAAIDDGQITKVRGTSGALPFTIAEFNVSMFPPIGMAGETANANQLVDDTNRAFSAENPLTKSTLAEAIDTNLSPPDVGLLSTVGHTNGTTFTERTAGWMGDTPHL